VPRPHGGSERRERRERRVPISRRFTTLVHRVLVMSYVEVMPMRNVTFSADERMIEAARARARQERTTLNEQFRRWLEAYATREDRAQDAMRVIADLRSTVRTGGRRFTRDERNER